jgi:putative selenate reductase
MLELTPLPFATLVRRMVREWRRDARIFDLPAAKFWRGPADGRISLGVHSCGKPAGTPLGPAAGPHTQLAQNIVLSWLGGARIMELKTVQVDDRLAIGRPCIDMANVGYNIEFSQELRVRQSLEEYVKAWMLIRMLEKSGILGVPARGHPASVDDTPHFHDVIFDLSVGYDLAGICGDKVQGFIRGLQDATEVIEHLRAQIPDEFSAYRRIEFDPRIVSTATLSTFHGCPADEIEKIVAHLVRHNGLHTVIKMNPTMLGGGRLEQILHGTLGYDDIKVNPAALTSGLQFDDSLAVTQRLARMARERGLTVGVKFSNTLEVLNHREFFPGTETVMYMSGAPLHPITMELALRWREAYHDSFPGEPEPPVSFSAGVDRHNLANCVACGFVPVTVCTDLLKMGGYGRMSEYLGALESAMADAGTRTLDGFIAAGSPGAALPALANHARISAATLADPRYTKARNSLVPKRIDSRLRLFDCISCDKCVPVCPNNANFTFELPRQEVEYRDFILRGDTAVPAEGGVLRIIKPHQIANFAPFCNECGNCDTFCPEYGGPFIEKPGFFHDLGQWEAATGWDGFHISRTPEEDTIHGRMKGQVFILATPPETPESGMHLFRCPAGEMVIDADALGVAEIRTVSVDGGVVDMNAYLTLRLLLKGVLHSRQVNYVNAAWADPAD